MMWRDLFSTCAYAAIATFVLISSISTSFAQVMQSGSYRIQSDSINFGGGRSTSSNYTQESTFGEVATGNSSSTNYTNNAGYQQMQQIFISLSSIGNTSLSPTIPGVSGGTSNGSTTVTVTTDDAAGYTLSIAAENSPALQKGPDSIADYVPVGDPDFSFITNAADSHFGFTPEGVDIVQRFKDNGSSCNTGSLDTPLSCWDGLSTSQKTIAQGTGANQPNGATTTIRFRVGVGGSVIQAPGVYVATTTITAVPL